MNEKELIENECMILNEDKFNQNCKEPVTFMVCAKHKDELDKALFKAGQESKQDEKIKILFEKFDQYACIKNDKWYLDLKRLLL